MQVRYIGNDPTGHIAHSTLFPRGMAVEVPEAWVGGLLASGNFEAADEEAESYVPAPRASYTDVVVKDGTTELYKREGSILPLDFATQSDLELVATTADLKGNTLAGRTSPLAKRMAFAAVLSSPPTLTAGTAWSLPAENRLYGKDSRFRVEGPMYQGAGATGDQDPLYPQWTYRSSGLSGIGSHAYRVAFDFDGSSFELPVTIDNPSKQRWRVWVNEQPSHATLQTVDATSALRFLKCDFGSTSSTPRRIQIELSHGCSFVGLRHSSDGAITAATELSPIRAAALADSYGQGVGATELASGYLANLFRLLGINNFTQQATYGSTGLYQPNTSEGIPRYQDRIASDIVPHGYDLVLIQASINDAAHIGQDRIGPGLKECVRLIRAGLPKAQIVVFGPLFMGTPNGGYRAIRREAMAAAAEVNVPFVDPMNPAAPWFYGTGKVGATTGDGPADFLLDADGVHPTQAGHDALSIAGAAAIAEVLGL